MAKRGRPPKPADERKGSPLTVRPTARQRETYALFAAANGLDFAPAILRLADIAISTWSEKSRRTASATMSFGASHKSAEEKLQQALAAGPVIFEQTKKPGLVAASRSRHAGTQNEQTPGSAATLPGARNNQKPVGTTKEAV